VGWCRVSIRYINIKYYYSLFSREGYRQVRSKDCLKSIVAGVLLGAWLLVVLWLFGGMFMMWLGVLG